MKSEDRKMPLRGYVIRDTIVLQVADWSNLFDYDYIEFHAKAKATIAQVDNNGKAVFESRFVCRQITCGDALCIMKNSAPHEIANHILGILHNYWKQLIDAGILPSNQNVFPSKVKCSLEITDF